MNTSRGGIRWTGYGSRPRPVRRMAESESPPIVVGDVVAYVSLDNTLNVRDHRTGHPRWDAGLLARRGRFNGQTAPAVVGDVLCAVSPGWVAGFRLSTGDPLWQLDVDIADPVPPSAVDRTVFVGGEDRSLLALNATTGKIRWETQLTRNEFGGGAAGTAVAGDTVIVGCTDGFVHALDAATGKRRPQWPAVTGSELFLPVCVHGDVVIAASGDRVYGIDVTTGERRWRRRLEAPVNGGLALGGGFVVACTPSSVCAIAVGDGQVRWQTRLKGTIEAPSIADDVVVVPSGSPHWLHAISLPDGRRLWDVPLASEPHCAPVVAGDRLLITAGDSVEVFAFDRAAGPPGA